MGKTVQFPESNWQELMDEWGLTFFDSSEWGWIIKARILFDVYEDEWGWIIWMRMLFIPILMNRRKLTPIPPSSRQRWPLMVLRAEYPLCMNSLWSMLIMKDPKSATYVHHNLVWYQCKLLRYLGLVIALCSMENCHILQDFWYRPFKTARVLKGNS